MSYKGNEYSFQIGAEINADVKALEKELNGLIGKMNANAEGTFTLNISEAKQSLDTLLETVSKIKSNFDNGVKVNIDTQSAEEDIKQLYAKLEDVAKNKSGDDGYIIKDAAKLQSILERVSSSLEKMKKTKLGEIFQTKDLATGELKTVLDENGKAMTLYDKIVSNADSNLAKVEQAVKDLSQALLVGQMPIEEYRKAMDDLNKLGLALAEGDEAFNLNNVGNAKNNTADKSDQTMLYKELATLKREENALTERSVKLSKEKNQAEISAINEQIQAIQKRKAEINSEIVDRNLVGKFFEKDLLNIDEKGRTNLIDKTAKEFDSLNSMLDTQNTKISEAQANIEKYLVSFKNLTPQARAELESLKQLLESQKIENNQAKKSTMENDVASKDNELAQLANKLNIESLQTKNTNLEVSKEILAMYSEMIRSMQLANKIEGETLTVQQKKAQLITMINGLQTEAQRYQTSFINEDDKTKAMAISEQIQKIKEEMSSINTENLTGEELVTAQKRFEENIRTVRNLSNELSNLNKNNVRIKAEIDFDGAIRDAENKTKELGNKLSKEINQLGAFKLTNAYGNEAEIDSVIQQLRQLEAEKQKLEKQPITNKSELIEYQKNLTELNSKYKELKLSASSINIDAAVNKSFNKMTSDANALVMKTREMEESMRKANQQYKHIDTKQMQSLYTVLMQVRAEAEKVAKTKFEDFNAHTSATALKNMNTQLKELGLSFTQVKNEAQSWDRAMGQFFDVRKVMAFTSQFIYLRRAISMVTREVRALDSAMTTLRITVDGTQSQYEEMISGVADMAKESGTTFDKALSLLKTYANSTDTIESTMAKIKPTMMLSNVTDFSGAEAVDAVQAILEQFRLYDAEADNMEEASYRVTDALISISKSLKMDFASGTKEIADGIKASGAVAEQAGIQMEWYASAIASTIESTRMAGSQIGNAFKTILTRFTKVEADLEDADIEAISKLEAKLDSLGIKLREGMNFRDLSEVFSELSAKWEELSDAEKSEIGYLASATRQRAIFENLMRNIADGTEENSRVQQLYNEALKGEGATLEANAEYVDSYTGKVNTMKGVWQEFASKLIESDSIKSLMDMMISLLEVLNSISPVIQLLVSAGIPLLIGSFVNVTLSAINTEQKFSSLILKLTGFDVQAKKTTATNTKLSHSFKTVGDRVSLATKLTNANSAGLRVYSSTVKTTTNATKGLKLEIATLQKAISGLSLAFSAWLAVAPYVTKWVDSFVNSAKYAREGVQEFVNNISEIVDETAKLNKAADSMERFEELWKKYKSSIALGVDDFLGTEEMAEFEGLLENLMELIPELKTLWADKNQITAQGIKQVNEELQRQIELQNILAKEEIKDSRKDVEKTEKNLDKNILKLSKYQQERNMYNTEMANIKESIIALSKELEATDNELLKSRIESEIKRKENRLSEIEEIKKSLESEILDKQKDLAEYDALAYKNNNLIAAMEAQGLDTTGMSEMRLISEETLALSEQKVKDTIARISAIKEEARTAEQQAEYEDALRRQQGFEEKIRLEEQLASKQEEIRTLQESIAQNSTEEKTAKLKELLEETELLGTMLTNLEDRLNIVAINMEGGTIPEFNISTAVGEEQIYDLVGTIREAQDAINNTPLEMEVVIANEEKIYDKMWEIQDNLQEIVNAQAELSDLGYLSDDTLRGLSEKYSEIMHYIGNSAEMQQFLNSLLDEEVSKKDLIAEQLYNNNYNRLMLDEQYYQTKIATDQAYINFHSQVQEVLANSELAKDQQTLSVFKTGNDAKIEMMEALISVIQQTDWAVAESVNNALQAASLLGQLTSGWVPEAFEISIPKVTLPSMPKPTYKPSSSNKTSSKKGTTEKEVADLKLKINLFYKWEKAIKDVEHQMSKLDKVIESGTGQQKVAAMKKQIELYKELGKQQKALYQAQKKELARLQKLISNKGFRVEDNGTVVNYTEKLKSLEKWANSATGEEKEKRKEEVQAIKELLDSYTDLVDKMNNTELEIDSIDGNIKDKQQELKDYYNDLLDVVSDVESEITDMIKKELDKRKEAMQKAYEKQIELLEKAKKAYQEQNEEENYQEEHDKKKNEIMELQNAVNIAMKDTSLAGKKQLAELQKKMEEAKAELAQMEKDKNRQDQEKWFDDEMEKLEEEQAKKEEEWDEKYDDKYIAELVKDIIGQGFTTIEGQVIDLTELMTENFTDGIGLIGDALQSEFLDKLEQAKEIASNLSNIFKEIGVNLNPRESLTSTVSQSVNSAVQSASVALSGEISSYLRAGVKATPYQNNSSMSIGSLLQVNGNIDRAVLPNIEDLVNKAVDKMQASMKKQFRLGTGRI